jgi:hypothetical protein
LAKVLIEREGRINGRPQYALELFNRVFWLYKRQPSSCSLFGLLLSCLPMSNLTKTTYLTYSQCAKAFWLTIHQPHLAAPPDPATRRRLRAGQEVDELARAEFPNGRLILYRPHLEAMAKLTAQAIAAGSDTLFQATIAPADLLVKVDILTQAAPGPPATSWHLIEVKSGTSYKPEEHLPDVAFQVYVLQQAGLAVTQASVMHLNRDYRHGNSAGNGLFSLTDITG